MSGKSGKRFQFSLATLIAATVTVSSLAFALLPRETYYLETTHSDGSSSSQPSESNYNCGVIEYGWPAVYYATYRSYD